MAALKLNDARRLRIGYRFAVSEPRRGRRIEANADVEIVVIGSGQLAV